MIDETDLIIFCIYRSDTLEYESTWHDCTHPQREYVQCRGHGCTLKEPDMERIKEHEREREKATAFWKHHREVYGDEETSEHICEIPMDVLREKHKHVLSLIPEIDRIRVGTFLMARYYIGGWGSRSCSGTMSKLCGGDDYMDFYCGGSLYRFMMSLPNDYINKIEAADKLDRGEYNG